MTTTNQAASTTAGGDDNDNYNNAKAVNEKPMPCGISSLFGWNKSTYRHVARDFHAYHRHDVNVLLHVLTTGLGLWGAVQLASDVYDMEYLVHAYAAIVALTVPFQTAVLHTAAVYWMLYCLPVTSAAAAAVSVLQSIGIAGGGGFISFLEQPLYACLLAIAAGYGLQDLAHYLCDEETFLNSYIATKRAWMLVPHTLWLLPLVIDAFLMRNCFAPHLFVPRNRCVVTEVANRQAVDDIRKWIHDSVPSVAETTHVWPHEKEGTDEPCLQLEADSAIMAGFRAVFRKEHYDVRPIQPMNEIYVTAVGSKKDINSDAVFYTPHVDGPYWLLPFCSVYRVLVGLTPNEMVRTRFNLQHSSQDQVVDIYGVLGFDYNRELHWIDHVPGKKNNERRSLMKLHYVVYPKGWHSYGQFCAKLNTDYNTWARGNFLRTLKIDGAYAYVLAWWIWLTTWTNAAFEEFIGWPNLVYIASSAVLSYTIMSCPLLFVIMTSFRHYLIYIATLAFREKPIAHGNLMRDAKLYKTIALMHLGRRVFPAVQMPDDWPCVAAAMAGFGITMLATARLGMVRTYFGSELGFVKPKWIEGFPYGTIPHPMIVGQLVAFASIISWFGTERLGLETVGVIVGHMTFYTLHMFQEMLSSDY